ncbi:MAG: VWA domain-containing protein [Planctomycetaceae bacterium]|nr:VWA domain-containing protein [Planctomycetaceae bacterium]
MRRPNYFLGRYWVRYWIVLIVGLASSFAHGQGMLIDESESGGRFVLPRPRPIRPNPPTTSYAITEFSVNAAINNQVAVTQVTQVFKNTGSTQIEARFIFPLPYEGAVDQMTFLVDGQEYSAKLFPADEARRIYQDYLQRNQDPALLQWVGTGMFQTSVFPIPVGASRTVTLQYSQLLRRDGGLTDYLFPLATSRYTSSPIEKLSFRVSISDREEIKNVYSPSHQVEVKRDDARNVTLTSIQSNVVPATDFRVVYDSATGPVAANLMSAWPESEEQGYFVLLASPSFDPGTVAPQQKMVLFVVDQSGSMSGDKIAQAREAAKFVIQNLRPDDMFNIISYHGSVNVMSPEMLRFSDETRSQALGFVNGINAGGMTNIEEAMKSALTQMTDATVPSYVVFLSDGMPTVGEKNEMKIAANCRQWNSVRARIISFGVGYDVNSRLLDRISRDNRGQTEYVLPNENLEASVARLYSKISAPVITNMSISYELDGLKVEDGPVVNRIYPQEHSELYAGTQLVLVGRYRQGGPTKIRIKGSLGGQTQEFVFDLELAKKGECQKYPFVSKLWAMRRIGELIDQIDLDGKQEELVNELVQLSLKHGIVTPYTAYLADENSVPLADLGRQLALADQSLSQLSVESGAEGFDGRSFKQSNKLAENLQGLQQRNAAPAMGGRSGRSGQGAGLPGNPGASPGQLDPAAAGGLIGSEQSSRVASGIRQAGSQTFYKRGRHLFAENAVDVDLVKNRSQIKVIKRFSDEWQALVSENTDIENQILAEQAEDEDLVVRLRGVVYQIE